MKIVGFLTEYNPMHGGHLYHIAQAKAKSGAEGTICVMSGNFVQRGDFAVYRKHARAAAAVGSGVDLVLELPTVFALSSAERFADSAVEILNATGVVSALCFGSESGDAALLERTAQALLRDEFPAALKEKLSLGISFAAARQLALAQITGEENAAISSANDILGIEYIKAIKRLHSPIKPVAIKRTGAEHDARKWTGAAGAAPSASYIRKILQEQGAAALPYFAQAAGDAFLNEVSAGRAPVGGEICERAILARLRSIGEDEWSQFAGTGEGLYHRFYDCAQRCTDVAAIIAGVKSKRYAESRIRRTILCAYLGIRAVDVPASVPYLRPLAFNEKGREILAEMKKTASIPILTKPADVRKLGETAQRLFACEAHCTDLYALAYPSLRAAAGGSEWRTTPIIL